MNYQTRTGKQNEAMQEAVIDDLFGSRLRQNEQSGDPVKRQIDCCKLIVANWALGDKNQFVKSVIETVLSRYNNGLYNPTKKQHNVIVDWLCKYAQLPIMEVLLEAQTKRDNMTEVDKVAAAYGNDPTRLAEVVMSLRKEIAELKKQLDFFSDAEVFKREQAEKRNGGKKYGHPLFN